MSLKDFFQYVEDIIEKENGSFFIETKDDDEISLQKINHGEADKIKDNREKNLRFYIVSENLDTIFQTEIFDELEPVIIDGEGGRKTDESLERISLRILSKKTNKTTTKIFNAIKNKLKKDNEIGMGVKSSSKLHDDYFYQKEYVGKKVFKTDFHNDKAPTIEINKKYYM
ncbi:hypothetical protein H9N25_10845 [Pedobacter riviphilus]|uniref:Uncharacterized protein n=1 Tax=Pedobacter riviphilus TaxID=2766984 RepID=A0ABX6TQE5_9SPHI|nr:hypothetical protein [Pedobacter riviphilus]QNR86840.1 hypothetical protein H9N25_10845 [Pedobacter riviphilus]